MRIDLLHAVERTLRLPEPAHLQLEPRQLGMGVIKAWIQLDRPPDFPNRFCCLALDLEDPRQAYVSPVILGIQLECTARVGFSALERLGVVLRAVHPLPDVVRRQQPVGQCKPRIQFDRALQQSVAFPNALPVGDWAHQVARSH